jgi:hypothetical protein
MYLDGFHPLRKAFYILNTENSFRRFLADSQLPEHASRGFYEAKMRSAGYSQEDVYLFQDAWKSMIAEVLEHIPLIPVWSVTHILFTSGSRHDHHTARVIGPNLYRRIPRNTLCMQLLTPR